MDATSHFQSLVIDIEHEHRDLQQRLRSLRHLAEEPVPANTIGLKLETIGRTLHQFRALMESHFRKEEAGGVIDEAVARLPRLAQYAVQIEQEHPQLLKSLDVAIRACEVTSPDEQDWASARTALNEFVNGMLRHEAAENKLLQQGFNEDFGLLDQ
jgi:iron-sulfur cluster repair protein YtfE (RIC family)